MIQQLAWAQQINRPSHLYRLYLVWQTDSLYSAVDDFFAVT